MIKRVICASLAVTMLLFANSCRQSKKTETSKLDTVHTEHEKGTFGFDLAFLQKYDSVIVLRDSAGQGQLIVSPKFQGKVFTSTATGEGGQSFGWVNYKAFDAEIDPHMNAYGGEDRLWLGPEGGPFSLYFEKGKEMIFANWKTPAAIDTEAWSLVSANEQQVHLHKKTQLNNYAGSEFSILLDREINVLNKTEIASDLNIDVQTGVNVVGFSTANKITNASNREWDKLTGAPCLWNLDMFMPADSTVILIPYHENGAGKVATTDYFGEIETGRIAYQKGVLFFKADGKSRGKLGLSPARATNIAGSYDISSGVLTVTKFSVDPNKTYLNQEWTTTKDPFLGDAVNAYNDGPLQDGKQMGPFYEIESVSPAAFLKPNESLIHKHNVYHFTGDRAEVEKLLTQIFKISVNDIKSVF